MAISVKVPSIGWKKPFKVYKKVPSLDWKEAKTVWHRVGGVWKIAHRRFNVGDIGEGGGKIFYVSNDGRRGLECAPADYPVKKRFSSTVFVQDSTLLGVYEGYTNTYSIETASNFEAAAAARSVTTGGKTDWFLPSRDELSLMYTNRAMIGGFSEVNGNSTYLSSSGHGTQYVNTIIFYSGAAYQAGRYTEYIVRPIREFNYT